MRRSCHGRITVGKSRGQFGIQPRILHNGTLAYRGLPSVDGKSRMGFAADRLIDAQYQISGTVIGKLDPVVPPTPSTGLSCASGSNAGTAGSTAALRRFASSSTAGILASATTFHANSCTPLSVFGSGYSGDRQQRKVESSCHAPARKHCVPVNRRNVGTVGAGVDDRSRIAGIGDAYEPVRAAFVFRLVGTCVLLNGPFHHAVLAFRTAPGRPG